MPDPGSVAVVNCPKCQVQMRTVDREGVHIEQCTLCRGVFLDAGELESIVAAENRFNSSAQSPPPYQPPAGQDRAPRYADSPAPSRGGYRDSPPPYGSHSKSGHRKRSFLESLFD
ncbi:MAG: zf-TFIIB domain-containing protein [Acidimicrobiales bacterium]